jgi:hypothetical protein
MIFLLSFLLLVSLTANGILVWYTKKLIKNLFYGIKNAEELQNLLNQYADSMQSLYELEQFYGDETIKTAIANTKMVVEACRIYKDSIIEKQEEKVDN